MRSSHIEKLAFRLAQGGMRYAFGVAGGGSSLELITALEENGVEYVPVAHEAAAALMAGAVSRSGKVKAVALTIKGPGLANAIPGILSNFYENRPAVTISEAFGPDALPYRMHKRLDHESAISKFVKGQAAADAEGENLTRLLAVAEQEIPGPVHLDLWSVAGPEKSFHAPPPKASAGVLLKDAVSAIKDSSRPAIILGSLAARKLLHVDWTSLGVPVATTAIAKGIMDETSPFSAGVITGEIKEFSPEEAILKNSDLILSFGLRNTEVVLAKPFSAPFINVDVVDSGLSNGFQPKLNLVVDDIASLAEEMIKIVSRKKWGENIIRDWKKKLSEELFSYPWLPASLFRSIQKTLPAAALVLDTGLFCTIGETVWAARQPSKFLGASVGRFMGTSVPTAIGFSLSAPDENVVCAMGDGGVRPYFAELKIAAERNLPMLFLLMSDGGYGSIAVAGKPKGLSKSAFEIKGSSWWRAAEASGLSAQEIFSIGDFEKALSLWRENRRPMFVEAHFDPDLYLQMTDKLR